GSLGNVAGICNVQGNVFGLMPHPERFITVLQHPQRRSLAGRQADGLLIFKNAYEYAVQCLHNLPQKPQYHLLGDLSPEKVGTRFIASAAPFHGRDKSSPYTRAINCQGDVGETTGAYADSGVDIAAGEKAVKLMKGAMRATQGPEVLAGVG